MLGNNNDLVRRRQASRGIGDYVADLPYRVLMAQGAAGPINAPVLDPVSGEGDSTYWLKKIHDLLLRLPGEMSLEWRNRFVMTPREAISFVVPSNFIDVGAGTAVALCTFTVQPRFTGFLTHVGMNVNPPGGATDIEFQIRVNDAIHPQFSAVQISASSAVTPYPFSLELTQSRTVSLVAVNTGLNPLACAGVLVGWVEYMASFKPYGSASTTGV